MSQDNSPNKTQLHPLLEGRISRIEGYIEGMKEGIQIANKTLRRLEERLMALDERLAEIESQHRRD